jgi:cobalt-zinc-cadmium efflux system outer membrane protein
MAPPVSLTKATTPKNLSIKTACALAVNHHPSLATYPMDRRAADARILQATRIPNPELAIDAEDFFGTGGVSGLSSSVLNALFTQVIERGGKREARTDAARSEGRVMDAEYEIRRRNVIQQTGELYIEAVAARENFRFLEASLKRSKDTANLVSQLSEAGRVTISAVQQAELEVQKTELKLAQADKASERASQALTAQWGDSRSSLVTDQRIDAPPAHLDSKSSQKQGLTKHPKIRHAQAQVQQSEALLKLAKANRLGDLGVSGGLRRDNGSDEVSGLFGLSLPLPVFDKRKDAIAEMTALSEKARTELAGAQRELDTEFSLAWSDLASAHQTAGKIQSDLLPTSSALFKSAEESFRAGKITSLEYLAAQQQFQDIRGKWLEARRDYQINAARVQALTNRSL